MTQLKVYTGKLCKFWNLKQDQYHSNVNPLVKRQTSPKTSHYHHVITIKIGHVGVIPYQNFQIIA